MLIEYRDWITRWDLKNEPDTIFLFGDNIEKHGYGGQAKEMRGEPNAVGIPTKFLASHDENAYFTDDEYEYNIRKIDEAFETIPKNANKIVIPKSGLGTGLAELNIRAPRTFAYLQNKIKGLVKKSDTYTEQLKDSVMNSCM
jgi:hypothetical protein